MCSTNKWYYNWGHGTLDEQMAEYAELHTRLKLSDRQLEDNYQFWQRTLHHSTELKRRMCEWHIAEKTRRRLGCS